jgi:ribosomal-protein-alanine N-acetyltransferase
MTDIQTARLDMRPIARDLLDDLHRLWTDPCVRLYLFDDEIISREQVEAEIAGSIERFRDGSLGLWGVFPKGENTLIGFCGYRFFHDPPELQLLYGVAPAYWSRGYATEAARAAIEHGFERLGFGRVVASADAPNVASLRVMERAGMKFDRRVTKDGLDTVYYCLSKEEYEAGKGQ